MTDAPTPDAPDAPPGPDTTPGQGPSAPAAKVVIAGTGRAGTTLLVQVMTDLGFDTGFKPGVQANPEARAGLEKNILAPNAPRVVKSPRLSTELGPLLESGAVVVEHLIIPVRDLDVAAASRVRAASYGRSLNAQGGMLWGTKRPLAQRQALAEVLAQLLVTAARHDLPTTLLHFPRFTTDAEYLHRKLVVLDPALQLGDVQRVLADRYRPDYVHERPLDKNEQAKIRMSAPVAFTKRIVAVTRRSVRSGSRSGSAPETPGTSNH